MIVEGGPERVTDGDLVTAYARLCESAPGDYSPVYFDVLTKSPNPTGPLRGRKQQGSGPTRRIENNLSMPGRGQGGNPFRKAGGRAMNG